MTPLASSRASRPTPPPLEAWAAEFRLIGAPDRSWDWPHIESMDGPPAFQSVEELLAAGRRCAEADFPLALAGAGASEIVEE